MIFRLHYKRSVLNQDKIWVRRSVHTYVNIKFLDNFKYFQILV